MSQEKVTKYKEEKANRKQTMKKQKRTRMITNCVAVLILAAAIFWVGHSAVDYYQSNKEREAVVADYSAIDDYVDSLNAEETAE